MWRDLTEIGLDPAPSLTQLGAMLKMFFKRNLRRRRQRATLAWVSAPESQLRRKAVAAVGSLGTLLVAHAALITLFEGFAFGDSLWLTVTSVTTVGYGDLSPATWQGRATTTVLIYFGGIFILGKFAGDFFDYRATRRTAMKTGKWDFSDLTGHIVVIGSEHDYEYYFTRLVDEFRSHDETKDRDVVLLSRSFPEGLPVALENMDVKFVRGTGSDPDALCRSGVAGAHIVVVLAWDHSEARSDGASFDIIHRIRETNGQARVVTECVDDENRDRLTTAGASVVLRPVRAYPEMIVGALLNPGTSDILENLFTNKGERIECLTAAESRTWEAVVADYVSSGKGIPIAFRERLNGSVVTAPPPKETIDADAIFVLSRG